MGGASILFTALIITYSTHTIMADFGMAPIATL